MPMVNFRGIIIPSDLLVSLQQLGAAAIVGISMNVSVHSSGSLLLYHTISSSCSS